MSVVDGQRERRVVSFHTNLSRDQFSGIKLLRFTGTVSLSLPSMEKNTNLKSATFLSFSSIRIDGKIQHLYFHYIIQINLSITRLKE